MELPRQAFFDALASLATADVRVCTTAPLLPRIGELASNAPAYDAAYVALAERLEVPLVTTDSKLSGIPDIRCSVRVLR